MTEQPACAGPPEAVPTALKANLTAGHDMWTIAGAPELDLLPITVSDGPNGVRGRRMDERFTGYCTPCGTALAATWDTAAVREIGLLVARDARRQGVQAVLGPTVNLHRSPLGGRGFECYSEDPLLTGAIAVAWVTGLQSLGVAATAKHFVANDSETSRRSVDVIVDEGALRELYLAPFEALARAGVWSMMAAYNKVNGTYCAEHAELVAGVLKDEWGWDGVVMSDWFGATDTVASALGGLDLEMPGPPRVFGPGLAAAVEAGDVPAEVLDDKVARLLRLAARVGRLEPCPPMPAVEDPDDAAERDLLRRVAADSFVLLRNEGDCLPVGDLDCQRVAVIGPHASDPCYQGGGSASLHIDGPVTPLEAIRRRFATADVVYEPGCVVRDALPLLDRLGVRPTHVDGDFGALTVSYYDEDAPDGDTPYLVETRRSGKLVWLGDFPTTDGGSHRTRVVVSGQFDAGEAGPYEFSLGGSGDLALRVDGRTLLEVADRSDRSDVFAQLFGTDGDRASIDLERGAHHVEIEALVAPAPLVTLDARARAPLAADLLERAVAAAAGADIALVFVGTTDEIESESTDRETIALPGRQVELVRAVAVVNPNTVVVVNAGMPVDVSWAGEVRALLYAWFPGQQFGDALADVLTGAAEPGGRLPMTMARSEADYPVYRIDPGKDQRLHYAESLLIGYRHFDTRGLEPAYPFGHGLGYTDFAYESMTVDESDRPGEGPVFVTVRIRNAGSRRGKELVQLYTSQLDPPAGRPLQQLAAFAAVVLDPGETGLVRLAVEGRSFERWDVALGGWRQDVGRYVLRVGRSSRDIRLEAVVARAGTAAAQGSSP